MLKQSKLNLTLLLLLLLGVNSSRAYCQSRTSGWEIDSNWTVSQKNDTTVYSWEEDGANPKQSWYAGTEMETCNTMECEYKFPAPRLNWTGVTFRGYTNHGDFGLLIIPGNPLKPVAKFATDDGNTLIKETDVSKGYGDVKADTWVKLKLVIDKKVAAAYVNGQLAGWKKLDFDDLKWVKGGFFSFWVGGTARNFKFTHEAVDMSEFKESGWTMDPNWTVNEDHGTTVYSWAEDGANPKQSWYAGDEVKTCNTMECEYKYPAPRLNWTGVTFRGYTNHGDFGLLIIPGNPVKPVAKFNTDDGNTLIGQNDISTGYENTGADAWMKLKLVIDNKVAAAYVNGKLAGWKPLNFNDLKWIKGGFFSFWVGGTARNFKFTHENVDLSEFNYIDFEFSDERSIASFRAEGGMLSQADGCITATATAGDMVLTSAKIDVVPGNKYAMKLPLRNTILARMANATKAKSVTVSYRTSDSGETWYKKTFEIPSDNQFHTLYFNLSGKGATGYLRQFKLNFTGASEGSVKIDAMTFEREDEDYDYAGSITSCHADKPSAAVTVQGSVNAKYEGKTVTLWQTDMRNWNESLHDARLVSLGTATVSGGQFTVRFPLYINGTRQTQLSNLFLASVDGVKVSPAFKIDNYQDFSAPVEHFKITKTLEANVLDYGAKGDGFTDDTEAFQQAIDAVKAAGSGRVVVPGDNTRYGRRYILTHIDLCSNLEFVIEKGAVLWQSQREEELNKTVPVHQRGFDKVSYGHMVDIDGLVWCAAYCTVNRPLIQASNCHNLRITGGGVVRMNDVGGEEGDPLVFVGDPALAVGQENRVQQMPICLYNCQKVDVTDITLMRSSAWHMLLVYDKDVYIGNVTEKHTANVTGDGFGINSCKRLVVDRCMNYTSDDAVLFNTIYNDGRGQFFYPSKPGEDNADDSITVRHSFLYGGFGTVFIPWGTEAPNAYNQEIRNIHIYDCSLGGHKSSGTWPDDPFYGWSALNSYTQGEDNNYVAMKNILFNDNTYLKEFEWTINNIRPWATNMIVLDDVKGTTHSSSVFLNGNFDKQVHKGKGYKDETTWTTGLCYWTDDCAANGSVGVEKMGTKQAVTVDTHETFTQDNYAGYVQGNGQLYEGLWLTKGKYDFSLKVKTQGGKAVMFVKDLVNGDTVKEQEVDNNTGFTALTLRFDAPRPSTYALGIRHEGTATEKVYIDDAGVKEVIDAEKYRVSGTPVVYTFESNDDRTAYSHYPQTTTGVEMNGGNLRTLSDKEYKVLFASKTPLQEVMAGVDIRVGEMPHCNAGIYLYAKDAGDTQDAIDALNVQIEQTGDSYVPRLFRFSNARGYEGMLASGQPFKAEGGIIHLKVVAKNQMVYVFVNDAETPCIAYTLDSPLTGDVGLRSQHAASVFDNFTIQSPQYVRKVPTGINLANREDNLPYYTMTGIKVNKPASKGVYIHGNRKIVVR